MNDYGLEYEGYVRVGSNNNKYCLNESQIEEIADKITREIAELLQKTFKRLSVRDIKMDTKTGEITVSLGELYDVLETIDEKVLERMSLENTHRREPSLLTKSGYIWVPKRNW